MKPIVGLLVIVLATYAFAKDKPKDSDYQPATLVSFRTENRGSSCSGRVDGNVDDSGNVSGRTNSNCTANTIRLYTIDVKGQTLTIEPTETGKQTAKSMATLGWSSILSKGSVLRDQLPGAHIEVRSDPSGLYVRVGKRESKFKVVEAH